MVPYKNLSALLREVGDDDFTPDQARRYQKLVTSLNRMYEATAAEHGLDKLVTMTARADMAERRHWLKRLVAQADVRHAEATGANVSEETRTLADIAAAIDPDQPRQRNDHELTPTERALRNRIELAISGQERWLEDPTKLGPAERDLLSREIISLSKQWDEMPSDLQLRMIEGGIAPSGRPKDSRDKRTGNTGQKPESHAASTPVVAPAPAPAPAP